jgi:hypothetical protein
LKLGKETKELGGRETDRNKGLRELRQEKIQGYCKTVFTPVLEGTGVRGLKPL